MRPPRLMIFIALTHVNWTAAQALESTAPRSVRQQTSPQSD